MNFIFLNNVFLESVIGPDYFEFLSMPRIAKTRRAFSLIELLVVIAIMGLVAGLTITGLGSRNAASLRNSGAIAGGVADFARQLAQSGRTKTALAVATSGADAYRALTVLKREPNGQWTPAARWTRLPENIIFDSTESDFFSNATNSITNTIQMAGTTLTAGTGFKAQVFSSDGSLDGQIEPLKLRLREGFSANGTQTLTAGTTNRYFDIIITPTGGRVKYVQP
jgi:prepilin-type N-terminal cleavage/methylation domain-containing protein